MLRNANSIPSAPVLPTASSSTLLYGSVGAAVGGVSYAGRGCSLSFDISKSRKESSQGESSRERSERETRRYMRDFFSLWSSPTPRSWLTAVDVLKLGIAVGRNVSLVQAQTGRVSRNGG